MDGCSFPRAFEKKKISLVGEFYEEFARHKRRLCKQATLSIGAPVGESGGGSLNGSVE